MLLHRDVVCWLPLPTEHPARAAPSPRPPASDPFSGTPSAGYPAAPAPNPPPADRPKFRSSFFLLPPKISLFLLSLGVSSLNFGGVFEGPGPPKCTCAALKNTEIQAQRVSGSPPFGLTHHLALKLSLGLPSPSSLFVAVFGVFTAVFAAASAVAFAAAFRLPAPALLGPHTFSMFGLPALGSLCSCFCCLLLLFLLFVLLLLLFSTAASGPPTVEPILVACDIPTCLHCYCCLVLLLSVVAACCCYSCCLCYFCCCLCCFVCLFVLFCLLFVLLCCC